MVLRFVCSWSEAEQRTRLGCFFHSSVFSKWQELFLLSPSVEPEECSVSSPGAYHLHRQRANIPIGKPHFPGQLVCVCLRAIMGRGKRDAPKVPGEELKFEAISGASFAVLPVKQSKKAAQVFSTVPVKSVKVFNYSNYLLCLSCRYELTRSRRKKIWFLLMYISY